MEKGELIGARVTRCDDGKYRWVYEMSLFKNPTIFWLIWKIFFFIFLAIFAFVLAVDARWGAQRLVNDLRFMGYFLAGMTAVVALGYLLYAAIMGGKYVVAFEMDEKGVNHRQIDWQARRARELGKVTAAAGAARGSLTTVGVGMNAQRTEMYSEFAKVRRVKAYPHRSLIKVNERFGHNQVYAAKEDFEFVKNYIVAHCVNIKQ